MAPVSRTFSRQQVLDDPEAVAAVARKYLERYPQVRRVLVTVTFDPECTTKIPTSFTNRLYDRRVVTCANHKVARRKRYYTRRGFRLTKEAPYGRDYIELWFLKVIEKEGQT